MTKHEPTFSFGKNWEEFIQKHFTEERIAASQEHLLDFLGMTNLEEKTFLDVGCGSGLSSLAAFKASAAQIVSFDVDPFSVKTTRYLRELHGNPENWTVLQGSALDKDFMESLEAADILYSWGVLHHTGSMWEAIQNTMPLVRKGGVFYIALYTTTRLSPFWIQVKKLYNRSPLLVKRTLEGTYIAAFIMSEAIRGKNPFRKIWGNQQGRGMEFLTDVRDWLGGWPYEDATPEEVQNFFEQHHFTMSKVKTGEANTEYLFEPQGF